MLKLRKELWFGLIIMAAIALPTLILMPWSSMTLGHYGLMMLALAHQLPHLLREQGRHTWSPSRGDADFVRELRGATLGIVGYGSIGREVARQARERLAAALRESVPYALGEAAWAARHEMARTVEDVLARRSRLLFLDAAAAGRAGAWGVWASRAGAERARPMARLARRRAKADFMGRTPENTRAAGPGLAANPPSIAPAPAFARERLPVSGWVAGRGPQCLRRISHSRPMPTASSSRAEGSGASTATGVLSGPTGMRARRSGSSRAGGAGGACRLLSVAGGAMASLTGVRVSAAESVMPPTAVQAGSGITSTATKGSVQQIRRLNRVGVCISDSPGGAHSAPQIRQSKILA